MRLQHPCQGIVGLIQAASADWMPHCPQLWRAASHGGHGASDMQQTGALSTAHRPVSLLRCLVLLLLLGVASARLAGPIVRLRGREVGGIVDVVRLQAVGGMPLAVWGSKWHGKVVESLHLGGWLRLLQLMHVVHQSGSEMLGRRELCVPGMPYRDATQLSSASPAKVVSYSSLRRRTHSLLMACLKPAGRAE